MSAEREILSLIHQYCYVIDTADFQALARLFEHGEWIASGVKADPVDAVSNIILYADGAPRTKHTTSNVTLEIDEGKGRAKGRCYVTVFQQTDDFPLQPIFSGDYHDEFECIDGEWRFARREIRAPLIGDMSAHLRNPSDTIPGA